MVGSVKITGFDYDHDSGGGRVNAKYNGQISWNMLT